jgi:hypothetical protein
VDIPVASRTNSLSHELAVPQPAAAIATDKILSKRLSPLDRLRISMIMEITQRNGRDLVLLWA